MKKAFYVLISLAILLFVGCTNNLKTNIPELKITVDGAEILVSRGSYEWTNNVGFSSKETVNADSASPEQIADTISGTKVKPQSELILSSFLSLSITFDTSFLSMPVFSATAVAFIGSSLF
ncbi:MAG: hypothetical protein HUJ77_05130 [Clostridium sp.]|uniref:hypothetical protein n=1 Tax=Clostridium sp. TaxID=1506 RepID=UPI0025C6104F|nr:hypothetical protein [Clostridium sp.]MCF0147766.1 hypothetical protein [Clostridium sp.]